MKMKTILFALIAAFTFACNSDNSRTESYENAVAKFVKDTYIDSNHKNQTYGEFTVTYTDNYIFIEVTDRESGEISKASFLRESFIGVMEWPDSIDVYNDRRVRY
jgi:hypothetical protein